ncbi:hypothetical protein, partial [Ensifer soli]|uniref:hypothetical protein n=1 Tax=Ciceribacter sp. sgz301302 TaxID=3342379 RepID=UPI0035B7B8FA
RKLTLIRSSGMSRGCPSYTTSWDTIDTELNRWLEHFHKVSSLRFVDNKKAAKVISSLKAMADRKQN